MNRPIVSFCYIPRLTPSNAGRDRPTDTLRTSPYTVRSVTSAKPQLQRANQIQPSKIKIPSYAKARKQTPPKQDIPPKPERPTLRIEIAKEEMLPSKSLQSFGWKSFGTFCGASAQKESLVGCMCEVPCKLQLEWTSCCKASDHSVYLGLRSINPSAEN